MVTSSIVKLITLEPTIHTRCKQNQLKLTPLSTPSLWKSSKTETVYQTTSLLMKSDCPTFWVCKMGISFNHRRMTEALIRWATWWVWGFLPQENLEIRKALKSYFWCFERTILSKMFTESHKLIAILCLILFACLHVQLLDFNYYFVQF